MNNILTLKGKFFQKKYPSQIGASNIPSKKIITINHLINLRNDLNKILEEWENVYLEINPLVSTYYNDVIAKSNRVKSLLSINGKPASNFIVGAKFTDKLKPKHIITYYISKTIVIESITNIEKSIEIIKKNFNSNFISHDEIKAVNNNKKRCDFTNLKKTKFVNTIVDSYYVERFDIERENNTSNVGMIVSIYDTGKPIEELLKKIGIEDFNKIRSLDNTTALLRPDQYNKLIDKAPYLVSMSVSDISEITKDSFISKEKIELTIPTPKNEPTVGVIDTMFYKGVYFSDWVEFKDTTGEDIPYIPLECIHGTEVSSIIVDGPSLNPDLEDGCGRFKVRHFGVSTGGSISSFTVLKSIKKIIMENKDIKVWNLSLGGVLEIKPNFISPEAAVIDQLQYDYDVIFIIAGTNISRSINKDIQKIGAPADSINSIVVNSVDFDDNAASYSREGGVLSFYIKPDVSYYGGDKDKGIWTYSSTGERIKCKGTSFAAPWITRKVAYLINILGFSKEVAKALIIDSATGWNNMGPDVKKIGYGIVPKRIENIVKSQDDEIRFILSGVSEKYDTYNFNIPVPKQNDKYPFISKATLCYFTNCSRNQGVDYTNTEMDLHFGRIDKKSIKTINENPQGETWGWMFEDNARKTYRKWDNIKHISEIIKIKARPKKAYENGLWGISIKTTERTKRKDNKNLKFGVIITLREMNGVNRIDEFIHLCAFRGWIVNKIDVDNQIDIYNKAEVTIDFED
ncbi:MAG: S8 family peptidase [Spirochaetaceae bacterium]|nr:S8 family peptidase [Spirochaetaceae bacterium]